MIEIKVTLKNGEESSLSPAVNLTIDNTYRNYGFKPEEIASIEVYEINDEEESKK